MPHRLMRATRSTHTWIPKYIFPGGLIPSLPAIEELLRTHTGLRIVDRYSFGSDYADTLSIWWRRFGEASSRVSALDFDHVFQRMWPFYLAYCEAGFRTRMLDVEQLVLTTPSS